jgi:hypothetical protein
LIFTAKSLRTCYTKNDLCFFQILSGVLTIFDHLSILRPSLNHHLLGIVNKITVWISLSNIEKKLSSSNFILTITWKNTKKIAENFRLFCYVNQGWFMVQVQFQPMNSFLVGWQICFQWRSIFSIWTISFWLHKNVAIIVDYIQNNQSLR